jgi:hypothetical protein
MGSELFAWHANANTAIAIREIIRLITTPFTTNLRYSEKTSAVL